MFTVEQVNNFKAATNDIVKLLKNKLKDYSFGDEDGSIEELTFIYNNTTFALTEIEDEEWTSEGKYEYSSKSYQIVSFDNSHIKYPCEKNIINHYNLFLNQSISRTGSYYSDWYYQYEEPTISVLHINHVNEVIIPEHDEITSVEIK